MLDLVKKYRDWDYTLNPLQWLSNILSDYKDRKFKKHLKKEYGEIPDWIEECADLTIWDTFNHPSFIRWVTNLPESKQKLWVAKYQIMTNGLDRLEIAIENELAKRDTHYVPDTTRS